MTPKADVGKDASVTAVPAEAATNTKANKPDIDQDYWKNVIGEATINNVLEKMVSCFDRKLESSLYTAPR